MTQENKELQLKDLCGRLPYGVICTDNRHGASKVTEVDIVSEVIYLFDVDEYVEIKNCKSYLRPMSSMTEKEKTELQKVVKSNPIRPFGEITNKCDNLTRSVAYGAADIVSYLLSKHFDIYNLIERGLALEAPEGMYNIKEK